MNLDDVKEIENLVTKHVELSSLLDKGRNLLHLAAEKGLLFWEYSEYWKLFCHSNIVSCCSGATNVLQKLIERGFSVNATDLDGSSPFDYAAHAGNLEFIAEKS